MERNNGEASDESKQLQEKIDIEKKGSISRFFSKLWSPVKEEDILKWERSSSGDNSKRLTVSRMMELKNAEVEFHEDVRPSTSTTTSTSLDKKPSVSGTLQKFIPNWAQKKRVIDEPKDEHFNIENEEDLMYKIID